MWRWSMRRHCVCLPLCLKTLRLSSATICSPMKRSWTRRTVSATSSGSKLTRLALTKLWNMFPVSHWICLLSLSCGFTGDLIALATVLQRVVKVWLKRQEELYFVPEWGRVKIFWDQMVIMQARVDFWAFKKACWHSFATTVSFLCVWEKLCQFKRCWYLYLWICICSGSLGHCILQKVVFLLCF